MRLPHLRPPASRRRLIILLSCAGVLVLIGSYILWSKQVWTQLTPTATQWHQEIKSDLVKAVALPAADEKGQDALIQRLTGVAQKISVNEAKVCTVNGLVQWQQQFIASSREARAACEKSVATTVEFKKKLTTVLAYAQNDQTLAKNIAAVPQANELADDTWAKQASLWEEAASATEKMTVTDTFKPTKQLAIKHIAAVKAAWQELIAAHQAKDKQKYVTAQTALATAIDDLDKVSSTSQQAYASLVDDLEKASQQVFAEQ